MVKSEEPLGGPLRNHSQFIAPPSPLTQHSLLTLGTQYFSPVIASKRLIAFKRISKPSMAFTVAATATPPQILETSAELHENMRGPV
jgi:hypothetical protein